MINNYNLKFSTEITSNGDLIIQILNAGDSDIKIIGGIRHRLLENLFHHTPEIFNGDLDLNRKDHRFITSFRLGSILQKKFDLIFNATCGSENKQKLIYTYKDGKFEDDFFITEP